MRRVILFARRPLLGRVKTRLVPPLTPEQALTLYRAFLADQLAFLASLAPRHAVELCVDEPWSLPPRAAGIVVQLQGQGTLGQRMLRAFRRSHAAGSEATVIIAGDAPTLPAASIESAFDALDGGAQATVVPAEDGGYVLVGLREPLPELFRDVSWGTGSVLETTRRRARASAVDLVELPGWFDVDDIDDLNRLRADLARTEVRERARETARVLERLPT